MTDPAARSRVAVVTGAVGAIGSAVVAALLDGGYTVVGIDRLDPQSDAARELRREDRHSGERAAAGRYVSLLADVRDIEAVAGCARVAQEIGDVCHVVGVAGGAVPGEPVADDPALIDLDMFRASLELNLVSQFTVVREFVPLVRKATAAYGDASLTMTSSINGVVGMRMPGYSAAKAGLLGLVRVLANQLGRDGIRVNAVSPGTVRTARTERIWAHDDGHFERLERRCPTASLATPEDVAAVVMMLVNTPGVTGQNLIVDGGQTSTWAGSP